MINKKQPVNNNLTYIVTLFTVAIFIATSVNCQTISQHKLVHYILFYQLNKKLQKPDFEWQDREPISHQDSIEYKKAKREHNKKMLEYNKLLKVKNDTAEKIRSEYNSIFSKSDEDYFFSIVATNSKDSSIVKIVHSKDTIGGSLVSDLVKSEGIFGEPFPYSGSTIIEKISNDLQKRNPGKILFDSTVFIFLNQSFDTTTLKKYLFSEEGLLTSFLFQINENLNRHYHYFNLSYNQKSDVSFIESFKKTYTCIRIITSDKKIKLNTIDTFNYVNENGFNAVSLKVRSATANENDYWSYTDSIIKSLQGLCIDPAFSRCSAAEIEYAKKNKLSFESGIPFTHYLNSFLKINPANKDTSAPTALSLNVEMIGKIENSYYPFLLYQTSFPVTIVLKSPKRVTMPDGTQFILTNSEMIRLAEDNEISEDKLIIDIANATRNKVLILLMLVIVAFFVVWWFYFGRKSKRWKGFFKNLFRRRKIR